MLPRLRTQYELSSLDGVADKPGGYFADRDGAMEASLGAATAVQDPVILGRRSYEGWAEFWSGSDIEPFAAFINGITRHVATATPLDRRWAGRTVVGGDRLESIHSTISPAGHLVDHSIIG